MPFTLAQALLFVFILWIPAAILFFLCKKDKWRGDDEAWTKIYFYLTTIFFVFFGALKLTIFFLPK